jgi:hypothetical protein
MPNQTKICTSCGIEFPATIEYFQRQPRGKYGIHSWCRKCQTAYCRKWRKKNPNSSRQANWKHQGIDISVEQYEKMFADQRGCCAVCGIKIKDHTLDVDHNHNTGEIRGLLCRECNIALGHLNVDDVGITNLLSAISYLQR